MKLFFGAVLMAVFCLNVSHGREIVIELPDEIEVYSGNATLTEDSNDGETTEPTAMDVANANLLKLREVNMNFQDFVMDEFNRFTLPMNHVINFGRLIAALNLTKDELDQLNPFYNYIMLTEDHFNCLINDMIIFSYSPRDILYKNLPEYLLQGLSDLLGHALSQSTRKFAETKEFKASPDYEYLSQTLQDNKDSLIKEICGMKEKITKNGPLDEVAINEIKTSVLSSIVKTSSQMFKMISKFNRNNNKFLQSVYQIVTAQNTLTTKIALAFIKVEPFSIPNTIQIV